MRIKLIILLTALSILQGFSQIDEDTKKLNSLTERIKTETSDTTKVNLLIEAANLVNDSSELKYLESALRIALKNNWDKGITESYYTMGWIYLSNAKLTEARENFLKATQYNGNLGTLVHAYGIASSISIWLKEKDKALEYAETGLNLAIKMDASQSILGNARIYLSEVYQDRKDIKASIANTLIAMEHFSKGNEDLGLSISLLYLFNDDIKSDFISYAFKLQKAYNKATPNDKRAYALSLFKMVGSYMELKQYEKEKEKQIIIFIAILAFLLLISVFLLWQNYTRKKMNAKLQKLNDDLDTQNQIKANILGVLNHDLRHPVARLINYLQLKTKDPDVISKEIAIKMEGQTLQMSKSLLQNIDELLIWSKDQMSNYKLDIRLVDISELFSAIENFFDYEQEVKIEYHNPDNLSLSVDELYLEIIMRNLTANAINTTKEQNNPLIIWSAFQDGDTTILSIKDNGQGMSIDQIKQFYDEDSVVPVKQGLGTHIIRSLSKKIGCKIDVETKQDKGTTINLIFGA